MDVPVPQSNNPFGASGQIAARPTQNLISVEAQRAIAEVQARMIIARSSPRNPVAAMNAILEDCKRPTLAENAVYQFARGGSNIEGPSIKLMEAIASRWGNIAAGFKEVSRADGTSEVICEAWDLESGYYDYRQFQVRHIRDTKSGGYALRDERDIYELIANQAQRRKRAVLQSIIPRDVTQAAVEECAKTLTITADVTEDGQRKLVQAFEQFGVTRQQIEARIQRNLESITPAQVVSLKKVYASLRDGMSTPSEWFGPTEVAATPSDPASSTAPAATGNAGLKERMAKMRSRPRRQSAEEERIGEAPTSEAPNVQDALALVARGTDADDDAAADLAGELGDEAVERVLAAIKARKEGSGLVPE